MNTIASTENQPAASLLANEIPPQAYVTITLKNGKVIKGYEDTHDNDRARGLVRLHDPKSSADDPAGHVSFTTADQIACFEMEVGY